MMREYRGPYASNELKWDDIYDIPYEFDTEDEAIDYYSKNFNVNKEEIYRGLHLEDNWNKEFPPKPIDRLRYYEKPGCTFGIQEMLSGKYILVSFY